MDHQKIVDESEYPDVASSSEDYASRFSGNVGKWFLRVQDRATLGSLEGLPGNRVLDVGGGHGQNVDVLSQAGYHLTITGSRAICRERIASSIEQDENVKFTECPLLALPFKDRSFDAVMSYRMMSHLPDWKDFLKELCRVASDRVIIDYPTYRSFNAVAEAMHGFKKGIEKNTRDYLIFHEKEVLDIMRACGFEQSYRYGQYFFPMALHRLHKIKSLAVVFEGLAGVFLLKKVFGSPVISCFRRMEK